MNMFSKHRDSELHECPVPSGSGSAGVFGRYLVPPVADLCFPSYLQILVVMPPGNRGREIFD